MKQFTIAVCVVATLLTASLSARPNLDTSETEAVVAAVPRVFVTGAVREPGAHPMLQPVTVIEALAQAGGRTQAAGSVVIWIHSAGGDPTNASSRTSTKLDLQRLETGDLSPNVTLAPGDTVYVPNANVFYVRGQVRNPGLYVLRSGMTVSQALALAGDRTDRASNHFEVTRTINSKSTTLPIALTDTIEPDDTIVVGRRLF